MLRCSSNYALWSFLVKVTNEEYLYLVPVVSIVCLKTARFVVFYDVYILVFSHPGRTTRMSVKSINPFGIRNSVLDEKQTNKEKKLKPVSFSLFPKRKAISDEESLVYCVI